MFDPVMEEYLAYCSSVCATVVDTEPIQNELGWDGKTLRLKCECHQCLAGETSHNDVSHDQSLQQSFLFNKLPLFIQGGTTKCARVMMKYFEGLGRDAFKGKRIVEVGAGTGLVSICLARLGADVYATDQDPMLPILTANIEANVNRHKDSFIPIKVRNLLWADEVSQNSLLAEMGSVDYVIGSDLIYAKEGIPPLVSTYNDLMPRSVSSGPSPFAEEHKGSIPSSPVAYLASIFRFEWENSFFEGMARHFKTDLVLEEGDIKIHSFVRPYEPPSTKSPA